MCVSAASRSDGAVDQGTHETVCGAQDEEGSFRGLQHIACWVQHFSLTGSDSSDLMWATVVCSILAELQSPTAPSSICWRWYRNNNSTFRKTQSCLVCLFVSRINNRNFRATISILTDQLQYVQAENYLVIMFSVFVQYLCNHRIKLIETCTKIIIGCRHDSRWLPKMAII